MENLKQRIMDEVLNQFNKKGMKFTMDDIASELHISKKTIYKEYDDKDELFNATVDYGFAAVKQKEAEILADSSLDLLTRISRIIVCLPDSYSNIDFRRVYQLKEKYPAIYQKVMEHVESDWGETEKLLKEAIDKKLIKDYPIPLIKLIIEGAIEKFLSSEDLEKTTVSYEQSLNAMIDIIINGLRI